MKRARLGALLALACSLALVAGAAGTNTPLPGGTSLEATINSPADGAVLPLAPVSFAGSGAVGKGAATPNTLLVYVVDVSGSTSTQTANCANQNAYDQIANTTLDCELLAIKNLNAAAISAGTVGKVAVIAFGGSATSSYGSAADAATLDLDNAAGIQPIVAPNATTFAPPAHSAYFPVAANDLEYALQSAYSENFLYGIGGNAIVNPGSSFPALVNGNQNGFTRFTPVDLPGNTDYWAAVTAVKALVTSPANTLSRTHVVFLSDGQPTVGGPDPSHYTVAQAMQGWPANVKVDTFAVGSGASCAGDPTVGSLGQIAQLSGGTCQPIVNPAAAATVVPAAIASTLTSVTARVDGAATTLPLTKPLPLTGPDATSFTRSLNLAAGSHTACLTAAGSDGGGSGTSEQCVTFTVQAPPVVTLPTTAGTTAEGTSLPVAGTASSGTTAWSEASGHCTFANPAAVSTTVTCDDNGSYTLVLSADDAVNPPVTKSETLTVTNVAPTAALALSGSHALGAPITADVTYTDPGSADTQTCSVDWGDGSTSSGCNATHAYTSGGTKTVIATVKDDDGAQDTATKTFAVDGPPAVSLGATSGNEGAAIPLAFSATDPDGDALAITWTATPDAGVDAGATCTVASGAVTCTDDGTWTLTASVSDGVNEPVVKTATVTVANVAPSLNVTSPTAGVTARTVTLTAAIADAGANDALTCTVVWGDGSQDSGSTCPTGHTYGASVSTATISVTVTDDDGGSRTVTRALTFNRPPDCTNVRATPGSLWPPNGDFAAVRLLGATDPDSDTLTWNVTGVTQDEAITGAKGARYDAVLLDGPYVALRAARAGNGDGRIYTIAYTVTDGRGGSCSGAVTVSVPHDQSGKAAKATPGVSVDSLG